jgi:hypothetical protein
MPYYNRDKRFFLLNADRNGGFRAQFSRNSMSVKTRDIPDHTTEEIKNERTTTSPQLDRNATASSGDA